MASVIAVHVWRIVPLAAVIILAGLISIPQDIKDAAEIDGAGFWRKLFEITLPLTLPVIAVAVLFGTVLTFTDMTVVYILTRGGPENATQVLPSWAFFKGIDSGDLAQGAAIALFLFPVLLAAAVAILRVGAQDGDVLMAGARAGSSAALPDRPARWPTAPRWSACGAGHAAATCSGAWGSTCSPSARRWSRRCRSSGARSPSSSGRRTSTTAENNPFLFNLDPTGEHVSFLFDETQFLTFACEHARRRAARRRRSRSRSALPAAYSLARLNMPLGRAARDRDLPRLPGPADAAVHPAHARGRRSRAAGLHVVAGRASTRRSRSRSRSGC